MGDAEELAQWISEQNWRELLERPQILQQAQELKNQVNALPPALKSPRPTSPRAEEPVEEMDISNAQRIKLVVVGDGAVGKTSLLISYATKQFPLDYVPTVFENYTAQMKLDNDPILLHLWDTAGQEDYDRLRPLSYPGSDIVLICFSTVHKPSYDNIRVKWYPEVSHYIPSVPLLLVGTKVDLRNASQADSHYGTFQPVTKEQAEELAKEISATKYVEISAKTRFFLDELFDMAVRLVLAQRGGGDKGEAVKVRKKEKGCLLL